MTQPLTRITYRDPTTGSPTSDPTSHHESLVDYDKYVRPLECAHNTALHATGIATGLQVRAVRDQAGLRVLPGVAVTGQGDHVVLAVGGRALSGGLPLPVSATTGVTLPTAGLNGPHVLTVARAETIDVRTFDGVDLQVTDHTPRLTLRPADATVDARAEVVLAAVGFANGKVTTLDAGVRRQTAGESVVVRPVPTATGTDLEVGAAVAGTVRPGADGGLEIAIGTGNLTVAAAGMAVRGPLSVETLTATTRVEITKETRVSAPLDVRQGLTVSGTTMLGAATVGGALTADSITPTTRLQVSRGLVVTGGLFEAQSGAKVTGALLDARAGLTVAGTTALTAGATVSGGVLDAQKGLKVTGAVLDAQAGVKVIGGVLDAQQGVKVTGGVLDAQAGLTVSGAAKLTGAVAVTGSVLDAQKGVKVTGALLDAQAGVKVTGALLDAQLGVKVTGAVLDVQAGLTVAGATKLTGGVTLSGALLDAQAGVKVTGAPLDVQAGLTVAGATKLTSGATVSGAPLDAQAGLKVAGSTTFTSGATVSGGRLDALAGLKVSGGFTLDGRLDVATLVASSRVYSMGDLVVDGSSFLQSGAAVSGSLSVTDPGTNGQTVVGTTGTAGVSDGSGFGVRGIALGAQGNGVYGQADSGNAAYGVWGRGQEGYGGYFEGHIAVNGSGGTEGVQDSGAYGVNSVCHSTDGTGVKGTADAGAEAYGVWGESRDGWAGWFSGKVRITGRLVGGTSGMQIDHPLDPEHKLLNHDLVSSPEMLTVHSGVVQTDEFGRAIVELPDWFEALNRDFTYQLTVLGMHSLATVEEEIADNRFSIHAGGNRVRVSWQVTGVRKDRAAERERVEVEEAKSLAGPDPAGKVSEALPAAKEPAAPIDPPEPSG